MKFRRLTPVVPLLAGLLLAAAPARAELWGYVDGQGVAHFAPRQIDARYVPVLARPGEDIRVTGKTDSGLRLVTWLEIAPEVKRVQPWLREAAERHGVDVELLKALIAVESGFKADAVSPAGALGLMQLTPATADRYATPAERRIPAEQRMLDARTNILTGARMLADLQKRLGGIDQALIAYNGGEGMVRRHGGRLPPVAETRAHVHLVLELYWALLQRSQQSRITALRVHADLPALR